MGEIFIRYIHFLTIMALSTSLVAVYRTLSNKVSAEQLKKAVKINAFYYVCMLLIFITGMFLWLSVGKPAEYYNTNWLFHTKLTIFTLMVTLSIHPTVFLLKNKNTIRKIIKIPKSVLFVVRFELVLLVLIPLVAVLIANGFGSS